MYFFVAPLYLLGAVFFASSHTASQSLCILAVAIALMPLAFVLFNKDYQQLFSCLVFFNLAPIWFLYLEGIFPGYDACEHSAPGAVMYGLFWAAIFQCTVHVVYGLLSTHFRKSTIHSFRFLATFKPSSGIYTFVTILCFVVPLSVFWLYYGNFEVLWIALTAGRSAGGAGASGLLVRESEGGVSSFLLPVTWLWQMVPFFGVLSFTTKLRRNPPLQWLSLLLGLLVVFVTFLSGSRGTMMFVAAPVLFFFIYYNQHRGWKVWLAAVLIVPLLIGVMELQVRFRGNLLDVLADPDAAAKNAGYASSTTFDITESHRDNNFYLLALIVNGYPEKYPFEGINDFFAILLNPVPRALWPGKPLLKGAQSLDQQAKFVLDGPLEMGTTSLSYTVIGEAYMSAGGWGILLYGFVYACFIFYFDQIRYYAHRNNVLAVGVLGVGIFLSFWGYRSFFALITFLYPVAALIVLLKIRKAIVGK